MVEPWPVTIEMDFTTGEWDRGERDDRLFDDFDKWFACWKEDGEWED